MSVTHVMIVLVIVGILLGIHEYFWFRDCLKEEKGVESRINQRKELLSYLSEELNIPTHSCFEINKEEIRLDYLIGKLIIFFSIDDAHVNVMIEVDENQSRELILQECKKVLPAVKQMQNTLIN